MRSHMIRYILFVTCVIALGAPVLLSGQQATEELPEALGTYLSAMEGVVNCKEISLRHIMPTEKVTFYGYKWGELHPALRNVEDWSVPNVSGQELSVIIYFTIGTRESKKIKLYRLRTGEDIEPFITPADKIEHSVTPITDIPGTHLGSMVRLVPDQVLTKGNYLLVEDYIERVDRGWGFTIDGGEEMWQTPSLWDKCCASLKAIF